MSLDTLRWALKAAPKTSSQKMVLISLADRANEELEAYPSTERLELDTLLDLKTVKKCLVALADQGFIKDTGQRKGKTGRVKVWKLEGVSLRETETHWKKEKIQKRNDSKNGTIESDQKRNDSKSGTIEPTQNRDDSNSNQPKNGTLKEPKNGMIKSTQKRDAEPPIVLTTQCNHPSSCSHLADASDSLPSKKDGDPDFVVEEAAHSTEIIPGWSFAKLLDPPMESDDGAFIALPLRGDQEPAVHVITDTEILQWSELYRAIEVDAECRLMLGWLIGNPTKRKTKAGIGKFITSWLAKASCTGGSPYATSNSPLSEFEKSKSNDTTKAKRERVRNALRAINNTDW